MMRSWGWICGISSLILSGSVCHGVIPGSRCFTNGWRHAGYLGDVPAPAKIVNVRDYGALGNGTNNDAPAIMAAISGVSTGGGVVYFPAGTYAVPNNVIRLVSGVVLRGERSSNTEIIATNLLTTQTAVISIYGADPGTAWMDMQSGYDLHSQTVGLADVTSFSPGDWVETRQGGDAAWNLSAWGDFIGQILQVTTVTLTESPAGTLTFSTPLRLQYQAGLPLNSVPINPQIRRFHRAITNAGVENLCISRKTAGDATMRNNVPSIYFRYAINCWVRGCEFTNVFGSACSADYSANCDITGNYIHHANEFDGGGSGYGVVFQFKSSEFLVENNIFKRLRHSMLVQAGANGNVFGYNYSEDQYKNEGFPMVWVADMVCHGNYAYANLFEGNCAAYGDIDSSHGANGPHNTYFRNRVRLTGILSGLEINDSLCVNQTFVGNEVLGNYKTNSSDIFTYGNNHNGTIKPAGSENLADYSCYLGDSVASLPPVPVWWNIPGFIPVYGPTNAAPIPPIGTERDIPARVRFFASGLKTYGPPSLYRQPTNLVVRQGETARFQVGATGTPVAVFQWYRNGSPVPFATNDALTIAPVDVPEEGVYWAVITDSCGQVKSAGATMTVERVYYPISVGVAAHGSISPQGLIQVPYGATSNFSIEAQSYYHISNVQTNGVAIPGAVGSTNFLLAWGPIYAGGTLAAGFAENLTTNGTPEYWLAGFGLTNSDFETAAQLDSDGDGHLNWMEYVAGTIPTNRGSVFRVARGAISGAGPGGGVTVELCWGSVSNRTYAVSWCTDLTHGFVPLVTNLPAMPPTNTFLHTNVVVPSGFYSIDVK